MNRLLNTHLRTSRLKIYPVMKTLNFILFYVVLSAFVQIIIAVSADLSLGESIYIGRCRSSCLHTFTHPASIRYDVCMKNEDCVMCWSSCRVLGLNSSARSSICADSRACFPGCQTACKFYSNAPPQNLTPPMLDSHESLPAKLLAPVAGEGDVIFWSPPKWTIKQSYSREDDVVLYIIMVLIGNKWNHFRQTSSTSVAVPVSVRKSGVRLVAVTSSTGAIAFYEGQIIAQKSTTSQPTIRPTDHPVKIDFQVHETNGKRFRQASNLGENIDAYSYEDHNNVDSHPPSVTVDYSWRLQLKPITMDMLARVEVRWEIRGSGNVDYMISWIESSGGLSGHMLSQQNVAEISVWPRQEYMVQVDLLDSHGNSVLRSVTESLSFIPEDEKKLKRKVATTRTQLPPTTTPDYDALSASNSKRLLDYFGSQQDISNLESVMAPDDRQQDAWPSEDEEDIPSEWAVVTNPSWIRVNNPLLQDIQKRNSKISSEMSSNSNSLLVWTVCLAVGAILIILLIVLAVRMLRNPKRAAKPFRRGEDGTSDTTVSSTNSSSFAMGSSLSNRSTETSHVEPWTYESFYGVAEHPVTGVRQHHHAVHHCHHQHLSHNSILSHSNFGNIHAAPSPIPNSAPRIDNASLIENYMLSVDHLPPISQLNY